MRLINANALIDYCNNTKDKTIDANDIARFPTVGGWISVKDRMPEEYQIVIEGEESKESEYVLCYIEHQRDDDVWPHYVVGNTIFGEWRFDCDFVLPEDRITYWMPLPEPPKEEEHECN